MSCLGCRAPSNGGSGFRRQKFKIKRLLAPTRRLICCLILWSNEFADECRPKLNTNHTIHRHFPQKSGHNLLNIFSHWRWRARVVPSLSIRLDRKITIGTPPANTRHGSSNSTTTSSSAIYFSSTQWQWFWMMSAERWLSLHVLSSCYAKLILETR